jgi:hypothetical protein
MKGADTSRFYQLLDKLNHQVGGPHRLCGFTACGAWPVNGCTSSRMASRGSVSGAGRCDAG